jgi:hypothetical protein
LGDTDTKNKRVSADCFDVKDGFKMALTLADAFVYIKGDDKQFVGKLNTTRSKAEGWTAKLGSSMRSLMGGVLGGVGAVMGTRLVQGMVSAGKEMIEGARFFRALKKASGQP